MKEGEIYLIAGGNNVRTTFKRWNTSVSKFASAYAVAQRARTSGESEDNVLTNARTLYREGNASKAKFRLENIWRMLRNEPKWQCSIQPTSSTQGNSSKRIKVNESRACTSSSNAETSSSGGGTPENSFSHSLGKTSSKREGNRVANTQNEPLSNSTLKQLIEMKKKEMELKEADMKIRASEIEMRKEAYKLQIVAETRKTAAKQRECKFKLLYDLMARGSSLSSEEKQLKSDLMNELRGAH